MKNTVLISDPTIGEDLDKVNSIMLSERVRRLREQSITTEPYISTERAELLTDFYQSGIADSESTPVARALALKFLLENKKICINKGCLQLQKTSIKLDIS